MVSRARHGRRTAVAALAAGALTASFALSAGAAELAPGGDFEDGNGAWWATENLTIDTSSGALCVDVPADLANPWDAIVGLNGVPVTEGTSYAFTFDASGDPNANVRVVVGQNGAPYGTTVDEIIEVTPDVTSFDLGFTSTATYPATAGDDDPEGQVAFHLGGNASAFTFCLDNVSLADELEILPQTSFADGLGDWLLDGATVSETTVEAGICIDVPGGTPDPWSVNLHYDGIPVEADGNYVLRLTASADPATTVRALVGENGGAYGTVVSVNPQLTPDLATWEYPFTATSTYAAEGDVVGQVALQIGGSATAFTFCVTDVSLVKTAAPPPPYEPETGPRVRVNQLGYASKGPKLATLVTDATVGVAWTLRDGTEVVAEGTSSPKGVDDSSGLNVHQIDFSGVTRVSDDFTLEADGETSHPFEISADLYEQLRVDSLSFFYPQRSGTEIDGDVAGEAYARPAGHIDVDPNQGDGAVTCLPAETLVVGGQDLYDGYTCDYTLDVTGGWYDAGDHGKYVVNGGISVAQLLSTYERSLHALTADDGALADGTLRVPESDNGVPDVLDEARWELEWMLKMQVPAGEEYEGMVHHKVTDLAWTGIPLLPSNDAQPRYLHRPSTAASLNLAAVAAQGARLFADIDEAFAGELLDAAEVAYAAALETPDLYAPDTNTHPNPGGGPYSDTELEDEFYWAAAELYITTGEQDYLDDVLANSYHLGGDKEAFQLTGFDWRDVAAFARIELATVPSLVPDRAAIKQSVLDAAWEVKLLSWYHPFSVPYDGVNGRYEWGSNGKILNNIALLAAAFDLSGNRYYEKAALMGMDYILGRNALNMSYVTGYGEQFSQNQHSRWYANQANGSLPNPPVGTVSGGPNSDIPDPVSGPLLQGCLPQFCYVDDIGAWGVNELTINWNSALAYVASFLADLDDGAVEKPFKDIPLDFPFVQEIRWLAQSGITTGFSDGTFRPSASVERQAMAAFLYRAAGSPDFEAPAVSPFTDVRPTDPFYTEIAWLAEQGITTGFSDGTFRSTAPIERQAMAAFLYRWAGEPAFTAPATSPFSDVATSHPFYAEITWLARVQITNGYSDGTFRSLTPVARDAMAAFLFRGITLPVSGPAIG